MRLLTLITVLGVLIVMAAPVLAQKVLTDDEIHDKVMQRLAADRDVKGGGLDVNVKEGVVTLTGKVREEKQKTKAEHIVRKVQGVKQVINNLTVEFGAQAKPAK